MTGHALKLALARGICALAFVTALPLHANAQIIDFSPVTDAIAAVRARVESAIAQATAARTAAEQIRAQVTSGTGQLTPELLEFIQNAVEEGRTILQDEWQGLQDFAPGGQCTGECLTFRTSLVETLTLAGEMTNTILTAMESPAAPDLSRLVALVQSAPPRTLYPIYRLFQSPLAAELQARLVEALPDTALVVQTAIQARQDACSVIVPRADQIQTWSSRALKVGVLVTIVGKLFNMAGSTEIEASAGVMGFAGGTIKANGKKKAGEFFTGLGTIIDKASTFATNKTRYCLLLAFQYETRATLQTIGEALASLNLDLTHLDAPVSSRATQASVDAVHATLRTVQDDVSTLVGPTGREALTRRILIEQTLAGKETPLPVFYLPEANGGLLEVVRDIVAESLTQHHGVSPLIEDGWALLTQGDTAKAQLDYRPAYLFYVQAYHRVLKAMARLHAGK